MEVDMIMAKSKLSGARSAASYGTLVALTIMGWQYGDIFGIVNGVVSLILYYTLTIATDEMTRYFNKHQEVMALLVATAKALKKKGTIEE